MLFTDNIIVLQKKIKLFEIMVNLVALNLLVIGCQRFLDLYIYIRSFYYNMLTYNVNTYLSSDVNVDIE